jgi:hypothetical protein
VAAWVARQVPGAGRFRNLPPVDNLRCFAAKDVGTSPAMMPARVRPGRCSRWPLGRCRRPGTQPGAQAPVPRLSSRGPGRAFDRRAVPSGPLKAARYSAWGASPRSPGVDDQLRPEGAQEAPEGRLTEARPRHREERSIPIRPRWPGGSPRWRVP